MMKADLRVAGVVVSAVLLGGAPLPRLADSTVCTPMRTLWPALDRDGVILAVATDSWDVAQHADLPFDLGSVGVPHDTTEYRAQRFVLLAAIDSKAINVAPKSSFWAVPLEGCLIKSPLAQNQWIPPGDTVNFALDPERQEVWHDGRAAILQDTYRGPHPGSGEARSSIRSGRVTSELSGILYFDFFRALPSVEDLRSDRAEAVAELETWVDARTERTVFPVADALSQLHR